MFLTVYSIHIRGTAVLLLSSASLKEDDVDNLTWKFVCYYYSNMVVYSITHIINFRTVIIGIQLDCKSNLECHQEFDKHSFAYGPCY